MHAKALRHRPALPLLLAALMLPAAAAVAAPATLSIDALPRPAVTSVPRAGLVVPAQVLRWRQEAAALEHGERGVERDPQRAADLYCRAARHGDAEAQYSLAWMLTNARGVERDDAAAAHLFAAAAEQGHEQAANMARALGTPRGQPPACLLPPADDAPAVAEAGPPARGQGAGRGPLVAPPRLPPNAPAPIVRFVELVAPEYRLEPHLVLAVMATESNFDPWAVSPKNARGLMQLIPDTARRFRVRDLADPADNIRGGMAYLRWLLAYFEGDLRLALAAYNAGERAVERYRGVPPFAETRMYVRKVIALMGGQQAHPFDPEAAAPSSAMPLIRGKVAAR
ncbi:MAG: transglycosylase SLT domain-containing protein [Burkholderiales bacterium]|nr:transglycosylase SLT domain-containing protein [Burkholderiales bacterium]